MLGVYHIRFWENPVDGRFARGLLALIEEALLRKRANLAT